MCCSSRGCGVWSSGFAVVPRPPFPVWGLVLGSVVRSGYVCVWGLLGCVALCGVFALMGVLGGCLRVGE